MTPKLQIGSDVWLLPKFHSSKVLPIVLTISGDTSVSWLARWDERPQWRDELAKIPKRDGERWTRRKGRYGPDLFRVFSSEEDMLEELKKRDRNAINDQWMWKNRRSIERAVDDCRDIDILLRIADLLKVELPKVELK